jgi:hypothetical protein
MNLTLLLWTLLYLPLWHASNLLKNPCGIRILAHPISGLSNTFSVLVEKCLAANKQSTRDKASEIVLLCVELEIADGLQVCIKFNFLGSCYCRILSQNTKNCGCQCTFGDRYYYQFWCQSLFSKAIFEAFIIFI